MVRKRGVKIERKGMDRCFERAIDGLRTGEKEDKDE